MDERTENEPNSLDFTSHGLQCALRRGPMGAWCGYVAIGAEHPLFRVDYSEPHECLAPLWRKRQGEPVGNAGIIPLICCQGEPRMDVALAVHGGVTYAEDHCPLDEPDGQWWIGFDCNHAGDYAPGLPSIGEVYRTIHYARGECEAMAGQLAKLASEERKSDVHGDTKTEGNEGPAQIQPGAASEGEG